MTSGGPARARAAPAGHQRPQQALSADPATAIKPRTGPCPERTRLRNRVPQGGINCAINAPAAARAGPAARAVFRLATVTLAAVEDPRLGRASAPSHPTASIAGQTFSTVGKRG
jgi:hypothetical protein